MESEPKAEPRMFLATARGGHCADPEARCPFCGAPSGLHRGVDLEGSRWFPLRAVLCSGVPPNSVDPTR